MVMKLLSLIISSSLALTFISGCSSTNSEKTDAEVERLAYGYAVTYATNFLEKVSSPLSLPVNTVHEYESGKESKFNSEYEKFNNTLSTSSLVYDIAKKCTSKLQITKDDFDVKTSLFSTDISLKLKPLSEERLSPFNSCVEVEYLNAPLMSEDLRIFLTEPNLKRFSKINEVRKQLDLLKSKKNITYKDAFDTYELLDNVAIKSFKDENKDLISKL